jgi:F-type H+-transporting ATPase subunit delta
VYSSYPLTKTQLENLSNSLSKHYQKRINIIENVDSSLVGGIKIVVDNEIIDATILNKLEKVIDSIKL